MATQIVHAYRMTDAIKIQTAKLRPRRARPRAHWICQLFVTRNIKSRIRKCINSYLPDEIHSFDLLRIAHLPCGSRQRMLGVAECDLARFTNERRVLEVATGHLLLAQTWPWVGLTHGLGWIGSSSVKYELLPNSTGKYYFQSRILFNIHHFVGQCVVHCLTWTTNDLI